MTGAWNQWVHCSQWAAACIGLQTVNSAALHGLTQVEFGRRLCVSRHLIQAVEAGRMSKVTHDALSRIARFARVPVDLIASHPTISLGTRDIVKARALERERDLRAVRMGEMSLEELHARNALVVKGVRIGLPKLR
jgi:transcriptional regulator with XRE-family HTH domain